MLLDTLATLSKTDTFTFAAFHDKDKDKYLARQMAGTIENQTELLTKLNSQGYGVYFTVNHCVPGKRSNASILQFRAIMQDDDKQFQGEYPLPPSYVVQTSPTKFQRYWLIHPDSVPDEASWRPVQENMTKWGNDPSVKDPARVLRVPGFYHHKNEPFLVVEIEHESTGQLYEWSELVEAFGPAKEQDQEDSDSDPKGPSSLERAIHDVMTGENFNNSLCTLSMHFADKGYSKEMIQRTLEGFMHACPEKDKRWDARFKHIPKQVDTALAKIAEERVVLEAQEDDQPEIMDIDWPPGLMGDLAKAAYNNMPYQNKTVAIVTALGLVAGIAGRKYNVSGTGLNLYLTLLMESGMGKDSIQDFISKTLIQFNEHGNAYNFLGSKRYTGPKALINELKEQRSIVSVFTEAGYLFKSSAGDQDGLIRAILDLYSKSGKMSFSGKESFSNKDDHLPILRAPSLTIVNEATPVTLIEILQQRKSEETGELPRMNIFRIYGDKPKLNRNVHYTIPGKLEDKLAQLIKECSKDIKNEDPNAIDIDIPSEFYTFADYCVDLENQYRHSDILLSKMLSRAPIKALKVAALVGLLNENTFLGEVGQEDWQWALKLHDFEMWGIRTLFKGGMNNDLDDIAREIIMPTIVKILKGEYKSKQYQVSKNVADRGIFPYRVLSSVLRNNPQLKALQAQDRYHSTTALLKVLKHMLNIGLIREADTMSIKKETLTTKANNMGAHYQVTNEFKLTWERA